MWVDIGDWDDGGAFDGEEIFSRINTPKLSEEQKQHNLEFLKAISGNKIDKIQGYLSKTENLSFLRRAVTANGTPALVLAAAKGNLEIMRALLDAQFDIHEVNAQGNSALHWAARKGDIEIVTLLIESVDPINKRSKLVNKRNNFGESALHWAAAAGHKNVVQFLCSQNANINLANSRGLIPEEVAKNLGEETMKLLKQNVVHHTAHEIKSFFSNLKY